jgi:hypothetical protein
VQSRISILQIAIIDRNENKRCIRTKKKVARNAISQRVLIHFDICTAEFAVPHCGTKLHSLDKFHCMLLIRNLIQIREEFQNTQPTRCLLQIHAILPY